ncbi:hypothetical protein ABPG75_013521 [Micractinium tetrahymenae]
MVRGGSAAAHEPEEEQICPLCINELDETEKAWLPCSCGYQLCLFCYDRLKTEFSNRCPNCRVEYDSDFQAGLRRRQERVAQLQKEAAAAREAAAAAAKAVPVVATKQHAAPPPPPPCAARSPRSPRRDLHIEQEQLWPSLGAATAQQQAQQALRQQQLQQQALAQQQQQQQPQQPQQSQPPPRPGEPAGGRRAGSPPQLAPPVAPPRLAPIVASRSLHPEPEGSSSSSADTAATTPQSPASSVVSFRAAHVQPSLLGCGAGLASLPGLAGKPVAGGAVAQPSAAVQGRCAVVLPRCGSGLGIEPDPEGCSLAASLQEAVRAGSLSVKQAAASLASYLRQRQQAAVAAAIAAAVAGSASSSPARGCGQPSSAGSTGSPLASRSGNLTPFSMPASALAAAAAAAAGCSGACGGGSGLLSAESSLLLPCDSTHSVATSASLSHWASPSSSLPMPVQSPLGGAASWQQQQQLVGSPVRDNDKLPLFMRRGTLRPGAALAGGGSGGGGSPLSTASQASSAGSGSFPGFPSRSGSPTPEPAKRVIAPPPGFGPPLGAAGIAALPRCR